MKYTVFAKRRQTPETTFFNFLTTLTRKDGTEVTAQVKFRDECGKPKPEKCPLILESPKEALNMTKRRYVNSSTGEERTAFTMWVSEWKDTGEQYVDHSMDDFED